MLHLSHRVSFPRPGEASHYAIVLGHDVIVTGGTPEQIAELCDRTYPDWASIYDAANSQKLDVIDYAAKLDTALNRA